MRRSSMIQCPGLTRETADVHLFQILRLENGDGQFASCRHVTQWKTDVTQFVFLEMKNEMLSMRWHLRGRIFSLLRVRQAVVLNLWFLGSPCPNRPCSMEFVLHQFDRAERIDRNRRQQRPMFCHRFHHRPNSNVKKRKRWREKHATRHRLFYFENKSFIKNRI